MSKTMLITTSLEDPKRLKRFEKILKRYAGSYHELWPRCWVVDTTHSAQRWSDRLSVHLEDEDEGKQTGQNERLFICSVLCDTAHCNGFLNKKLWEWILPNAYGKTNR